MENWNRNDQTRVAHKVVEKAEAASKVAAVGDRPRFRFNEES